ncbi:MAG TPA: hypothetical protein VIY48_18920 [Candidatus Paceibacterota bacterium]
MSQLIFEDPPDVGAGGKSKIVTPQLLLELAENEGKWARIHESSTPYMAATWQKRYSPQGYEFTSRLIEKEELEDGSEKKTYYIYARYVGTPSGSDGVDRLP